jgi:hypothetical protein
MVTQLVMLGLFYGVLVVPILWWMRPARETYPF